MRGLEKKSPRADSLKIVSPHPSDSVVQSLFLTNRPLGCFVLQVTMTVYVLCVGPLPMKLFNGIFGPPLFFCPTLQGNCHQCLQIKYYRHNVTHQWSPPSCEDLPLLHRKFKYFKWPWSLGNWSLGNRSLPPPTTLPTPSPLSLIRNN